MLCLSSREEGTLVVQPRDAKMDAVSRKMWEVLSGIAAGVNSPCCSETDSRQEQSNAFTCHQNMEANVTRHRLTTAQAILLPFIMFLI